MTVQSKLDIDKQSRPKRNSLKIGQSFKSNFNRVFTVVENCGSGNYIISSEGINLIRNISEIKSGQIKHPYDRTIYGKGYLGIGKYTYEENKHRADCWRAMFKRCYSGNKHYANYLTVDVDCRWYNFQNFAEWYDTNYIDGFELDKDLKSIGKAKTYSPETCMFISNKLNKMLSHNYNSIPIKEGHKYRARISLNGRNIELGRYNSWENAIYFQVMVKFSIIEQTIAALYGNDFKDKFWNKDRLLIQIEDSLNDIKNNI